MNFQGDTFFDLLLGDLALVASLDRCGSPRASPDSCGYHINSDKVRSKQYIGIENAGTSTLTIAAIKG
jgi:hypothetical protein